MAGDACVLWEGTCNKDGYGLLTVAFQGSRLAHRKALADALGRPIAPGKFALHTCDNPPCVKPAHLYEGTQADNNRDKKERGRTTARFRDVPACIHGHPFDDDNTLWYERPNGYLERRCITCRRIRHQQQAARRKLARAEAT